LAIIVEYVSLYTSCTSLCFITAIFLSFSRMFLFLFVTFVLFSYLYKVVFATIVLSISCTIVRLTLNCSLFICVFFTFNVYFLHSFFVFLLPLACLIYLQPSSTLYDRSSLWFCYSYLWEIVCNQFVLHPNVVCSSAAVLSAVMICVNLPTSCPFSCHDLCKSAYQLS